MFKNKIGIIIVSLIALFLILMIGPVDTFTHGFFCEEMDVSQVDEQDKQGNISLEDGAYEISFSPRKHHFAGFELYLVEQPKNNDGMLTLAVYNASGEQLESMEVSLSEIKASTWFRVYSHASLKPGEVYTLAISAQDTSNAPSLMLVSEDYLPAESVSGNAVIGYAYRESTFSLPEKCLIVLFILSLWGIGCYLLLRTGEGRKKVKNVSVFLLLTVLLAWNYMFNSMDADNTSFSWFHYDTETLVVGEIYAERDGISSYRPNEAGYGLGLYRDLKGILKSYDNAYVTDDNWLEGYNREFPAILVAYNMASGEIAYEGYYVRFENGEEYQITHVDENESYFMLTLSADRTLSYARNGSLDRAVFYTEEHEEVPHTVITSYVGQFGLQGKVFRSVARLFRDENTIAALNLICSLLTAVVFVILVWLLSKKYNYLFAGCFYVTFWLSPWVVNFARNLYWVEFTWFLPMVAGVFCAWKIHSRKSRVLAYAAAFLAVLIKCLCGYEYTTAVMLGLIAFPMVDFIIALSEKDKRRAKVLLRAVILLGLAALAGFVVALCLHGQIKGNGDIVSGIRGIIQDDALRRTNGADLNDYDSQFWPSMNASIWETLRLYFRFSTQIITGIPGNLFPLLCLVPLAIFGIAYSRKKKLDVQGVAMYVVFFVTSVSWICLAKSHSYIHTFLNFVLWYFGFVQTSLYCIVSRIVAVASGLKAGRRKDQG